MKLTRESEQIVARTSGWMKRSLQAAVVFAVAATVPAAWAAGGRGPIQINNVAAGVAALSRAGNVTTIRTGSVNTIINYQRFNVFSGQRLNFVQPTATSRVLNRIQGPDPSHINGTISSNGIVYLVNPAGVIFGQGAVINVGGFFAAASHMSDANFLNGRNAFTDSTGKVVNAGFIGAKEVHLVGAQVENTGQIVTDGSMGIVTMTAGKDVLIGEVGSPADSPNVMVKVSGPASNAGGAAVKNSGRIDAGRGQVLMGAGDVFGIAIANSGPIKGHGITLQGGKGIVMAGGSLDASSADGKGGDVKILGQQVGVTGAIDASGATGGGNVRIGGDFHGQGSLPTADKTSITSTATIKADATGSGAGGTVVVWSNSGTRFAGWISAQGAGTGSTGGFVELSGGVLDFTGNVNVTSAGGATGTLLLDPDTITIDGTGSQDGAVSATGVNFADPPTVMSISFGKITTLMETNNVLLQANNLIHVMHDLDLTLDGATAGKSLTLEVGAGGVIQFDPGFKIVTNNGDLELKGGVGATITMAAGTTTLSAGTGALKVDLPVTGAATTNLTLTGNTVTLGGSINVGGTLAITSNSAASDLTIGNNLTGGSIALTTNKNLVNTAIIDTSAGSGTVTIAAAGVNLSGGTITAGTGNVNLFNVDPTQPITLAASGAGYLIKPGDLTSITAATITIGQSGVQRGVITAQQFNGSAVTAGVILNSDNALGGGVSLDDGGAGTALQLGGNLTITASTAGITAVSPTNTFAEISAAGTVSLNSSNVIGSATKRIQFTANQTGISVNSTGDVFLDGLGTLTLGTASSSTGTLNITTEAASAGSIKATGTLSGATVNLNADGGIGTLVQRVTFAANQTGITLVGGGDIDIDGVGNLTFLAVTSSAGAIDITTQASGNIQGSGTFSAFTTASLNAGGAIGTSGAPITFASGQTGVTLAAGGNIFVKGLGNLGLVSSTTTGNLTVTTATGSGGNINATGTLGGAAITLNADGGIGTGGTVTLNPTGTVTLTTAGLAAAGNMNVSTGAAALNTPVITIDAGGGQTVTLGGGAITLGTTNLHTADLVINGGSLATTGGTTVTAHHLSAALTGGVSIGGTVTLTGDFTSTGTTFGVTGTGSIAAGTGGNINILQTGAVSLAGNVNATATGTVRIAGTTVGQTGGVITAAGLGVRAAGAVTLTQSNAVGSFGAADTTGGAGVSFTDSGAFNLSGVTTLAAAGPFPAFTAVAGIATNAGPVTINGGNFSLNSTITASDVLITAGDVTDGGVGVVAANNLGIIATGNITLNTIASNAVGNFAASTAVNKSISFKNSAGLTIGSVAAATGFAGVTGVTTSGTGSVTIQSTGAMTLSQAVTAGTGGASLTTTTSGNINGTATISGGSITLNAAGGIGNLGVPTLNTTGAISLTTAGPNGSGNIFVSTGGNSLNTSNLTISTAASTQTISFVSGTFTVDASLNIGTDKLQVGGTSFVSNGGTTLAAGSLLFVGNAQVGLAGNINVGGGSILLSATDIIQTGGSLTAGGLATITSSQDGSNRAVQLTAGTNAINIFASNSTASGGTIALTTSGNTTVGSFGAAGGSGGVGTFAALGGVAATNANITIKANGSFGSFNAISAGTGTVTLATLPASASDITLNSGGTVTGANVVLASDAAVTIAATVTAQNAGAGTFKSDGAAFNLNAGGSIVADTANIIHTGNVGIGASISATTLRLQGAAVNQTAGTITTTALGARSTSGAVTLNNVTLNSGGTVAAVAPVNQNVSITTTNGVQVAAIGSGTAVNNAGGTDTFNAISGVTTTGTGTTSITAATGNVTGTASDAVSGTTVNVTATTGGIGTAGTGLIINSTGTATLTSGGANSAGDIHITTTGATLGGLVFVTSGGSVQTITIDKATGLTINGNVNAGTDTLVIHAATSGIGDLAFGGGVTLTSPNITLWAGIGDGSLANSIVNISTVPTLSGTTSLTVRQDAALTDAGINGSGLTNYTLQSDGGNVTVGTAGNVAGTNLTLTAQTSGTVNINAGLSLASLVANGATINLAGNVSSTGDQTYNGAVVLKQNETVSGANVTFTGTIVSQASQAFTLAVTGSSTVAFEGNIGGTIGGTAQLGSLTVSGAPALQFGLSGAFSVVTTGGQTYDPAITLLADTTLNNITSGAIQFNATINGAHNLAVNSAGNEVFEGKVGTTAALTSLTTDSAASGISGGKVVFNGGSTGASDPTIKTSGAQLYRDGGSLTADTTLTSTGSGDITFAGALDGGQVLNINTGGITTFGGTVGGTTPLASVTTDAAGFAHLNGGGITTTGNQTYNDVVTLGAATTLNSNAAGDLTFASTVDGGQTLAMNTTGNTVFGGVVGGTTPLTSVTTNVGGTTHINTAGITTTGGQIYNDVVSLGANATLTSNSSGVVTFVATVNGAFALVVNTAGVTTFGAAVGGATALTSVTTDSAGSTAINGGAVTTDSFQHFNDAVTLGAATTLTSNSSGDITLGSTVNGAVTLVVNTGGTTTFGGVVGGSTPLTSITTDVAGFTDINAAGITTTGLQTYHDPVFLGANATLTSSGSGNITFGSTVNGGFGLVVNTSGVTIFTGAVGNATPLASVVTNAGGSTHIDGGIVTTTGLQTYNDPILLGAGTIITSGAVGTITFASTIDGAQTLVVNTAGTTIFEGVVGGSTPLASLTTDALGTTDLNIIAPHTVTTTGIQFYGDDVLMTADAILTSTGTGAAGNITFNKTVNGAFNLTVNTAGTTTFNGVVGAVTNLLSITTDAPGTTIFNNAPATTTDNQIFNDDVVLSTDTVLTTSPTGFVHFFKTVNGSTAGGQSLTIFSATDTTFDGAVGNLVALHDLSVNHFGPTPGSIFINGGVVNTTGVQSYNYKVVLGANTTLTSTGAGVLGNVTFASTVNGPFTLAVNTAGITNFMGAVGGTTALTSVTTNAAGSTDINGGAINTTGIQLFNDPVTLSANAVLTSTGSGASGNITLGSTVNGAFALTINTAGTTTFGGAVGGTTPLASVTTDAPGTTDINGSGISTTGIQLFSDPVTLSASTVLTSSGVGAAGNITFGSTVDGGFSLTVNTAGTTTFTGAVGGATPLASVTTDGAGTTDINGGLVATSGLQLFGDNVILSADTVLSSNSAGNITLGKTVNGAFDLTIDTAGVSSFLGAVGNVTPLSQLHTDVGGTTDINGGVINTSNVQFFGDDVILSANATLTSTGTGGSGNITFDKTVNGAFSLTVNTAGTTLFNGVVGGVTNLTTITTDAPGTTVFNNAPATSTDDQDFLDDVVFLTDTTLTTSPTGFVHFHKTVNGITPGGQSLTIFSATDTIFDGQVGNLAPLHDLTVNHFGALPGTIFINGGVVNTTGVQSYNYKVVLGATTVLTSTGTGAAANVTFGSTLDGAFALTVNTAGVTHFVGAVGGTTALASLTTDAAGSADINGGIINTTGLQLFNDDVVLSANAVLTSSGAGAITFGKTVNGAFTLAVNTTGVTTFTGTVGDTAPLTSVTTNAGGSTAIDGGLVATTGVQLFNDAVTLGADTTLSSTGTGAAGNITFITTLDGAQNVVINTAGVTTFGGVVGGGTALTSVTTNAGGSTAINGGGVTTTGLQSYHDNVTLGTNAETLTSTGAGVIHFFGTVNGPKALTVTTAGLTIFDGLVGGTSGLASLTTDGGGATQINGGGASTLGLQNYHDSVTLGVSPAVLASTAGGAIHFFGALDGPQALTVNTVGATTFGGIVGGILPLASLTTNAGGSVAINGGAVTTTGLQRFNDAATLGANTVLTGSTLAFVSSLNSTGSARGLTINNGGNVLLAGPTGSLLPLGSVIVAGAGGTTTINGTTIVQGLTIADNAHITGAVTSSGAVAVAGAATITGSVRSISGAITLTGAASVNGSLTASGTVSAGAGLTLAGSVKSSSGDVMITGPLTLSAGSNTMEATAGIISVPGAVHLNGSLVVTAGGTGNAIALGTTGNINGSGGLKFVTTGSAGSTTGPIITVGAIGSSAARIGALEFDSSFLVRLGGDVYAGTATFAGPTGGDLTHLSLLATISHDAGDLTINTAGKFTMDQGQKLSVFDKTFAGSGSSPTGNLTIISNNSPIQIGDLSALGKITVNAGSVAQIITVVARPGGGYLKADGTTGTDRGTDIIAGAQGIGGLSFTGTIKLLVPANVPSSAVVQFASPLAQTSLNAATVRFDTSTNPGIKILTQNQSTNLQAADFESQDFITSADVLDLAALGIGNPVSSLSTVVTQTVEVITPVQTQAISSALKGSLQEIGIFARDTRTDEVVDSLIGRAFYDDVPYKLDPSLGDNQVASDRLPYAPVIPTVDAYRALFLKEAVDQDGKPVLDENGKPKMVAQDTVIKNSFGQEWQLYAKANKEGATPEGFRAFLEANAAGDPKAGIALGYLDKLRDLLVKIKSLGLTDTEFEVSKKVLLAKARPANIKEGDFLGVVNGPSSRTTPGAVASAVRG